MFWRSSIRLRISPVPKISRSQLAATSTSPKENVMPQNLVEQLSREQQIAALEKEKQKVMAVSQQAVTKLNHRINNLKAITA